MWRMKILLMARAEPQTWDIAVVRTARYPLHHPSHACLLTTTMVKAFLSNNNPVLWITYNITQQKRAIVVKVINSTQDDWKKSILTGK